MTCTVNGFTRCFEYALFYLERGLPLTLCGGPDLKDPGVLGDGWQDHKWTPQEVEEAYRQHHELNPGVVLGPRSGMIDLEADVPEAEDDYGKLFDGCEQVAPTYQARRGKHRLHGWDDRLEATGKAKFHYGALEVRLGAGGKSAQSVLPPGRNTDGTYREWLPGLALFDDLVVPPLPDLVIDRLIESQKAPQPRAEASEATTDDRSLLMGAALAYLAKIPGTPEGHRDEAAFSVAGHLASFVTESGARLGEAEILSLLRSWNLTCNPPLGEWQLAKCAKQGMGGGTPREDKVIKRPKKKTRQKAQSNGRSSDVAADIGAKPTIEIITDEPAVVNQAIAALSADPTVFARGSMLVHVVRDDSELRNIARPAFAPRIVPLTPAGVRERLAGCARWVKMRETENSVQEIDSHPPEWCVNALMDRGTWKGIRRIEAIIGAPVIRPDGTVLSQAGYDQTTGLLFEPETTFPPVPENPTLADAQAAAAELLDVVSDFPFASRAHQAGWLAAVLTPPARFGFHGSAPLFAIGANAPGAGKGLLVDATSLISIGRPTARMTNPDSDDEMRKRITTLAIEGERAVLLDNVGNVLGCPSLDAALTATSWKDRILGVNRSTGELPLAVTWYATGNNLIFNGDTTRRTVHIRLESPMENPEERQGFKIPDLLPYVLENRGRLAVAAITVLRAFCAAGRPKQKDLKPWGSFEAWSDIVRQAIVWAGFEDPGKTRDELKRTGNRDTTALRMLIDGWLEFDQEGGGVTAHEVLQALEDNTEAHRKGSDTLRWQTLRAAIAELCPAKAKFPTARSLGMKLYHLRGRVIGNQAMDSRASRSGELWRVIEVRDKQD